jgi:hypothetical protein
MPTTYIIDYDAMQAFLKQETQNDPERDYTPFDFLHDNIEKPLAWMLNTKTEPTRTIAVTLDSTNREVTVFGEPIEIPQQPLFVLAYMRDKTPQEQLYHLFTDLVDYAQRTEQYDRFFRAIQTE